MSRISAIHLIPASIVVAVLLAALYAIDMLGRNLRNWAAVPGLSLPAGVCRPVPGEMEGTLQTALGVSWRFPARRDS